MAYGNLTIIGTCPTFRNDLEGADYLALIRRSAVRAERNGLAGMLVYSDHRQFDPWVAAAGVMQATTKLSPLVAVQPVYAHPFTVAKTVASLSILYERPVHLNFISGGFPLDSQVFCDELTHDQRYDRLAEYGHIIRELLRGPRPVTLSGKYYSVEGLRLSLMSAMPDDCTPILTTSGSSPAGLALARRLEARAIQYLRPSMEYADSPLPPDLQWGTRLGIFSRPTTELAWQQARARFPDDKTGQELREFFVAMSDSVWVKELNREINIPANHPYWLGPYKNNQASCPFLVGSREDVARELAGYIALGITTFLVEDPVDDADAEEIAAAFWLAETVRSYRVQ